MTLQDNFTRRPDHRAGDMAQIEPVDHAPYPGPSRATVWRCIFAGLALFWGGVVWTVAGWW